MRHDLIKVVERQNSPLFLNFICNGITDRYTKKVFGYNLGYPFYLYINGEVFITKKSLDKLQKKFDGFIKNKRLDIFLKKWKYLFKKLLLESKNSNYLISKHDSKIIEYFSKLTEDFYLLSTSLMLVLPIESFLLEKIKIILKNRKIKDIEEEILRLTSPSKRNENEKEVESIYNISKNLNSNKLDLLISEHIKKYGWLNSDRFFRDPWTKKEIIDRAKNAFYNTQIKRSKAISLKLNKQEKEIICLAQEYVFFRTYRMNCFIKSGFLIKPLLNEISKRLGIVLEDLIYLTPEEIVESIKNKKVNLCVIKERKKEYGYYIKDNTNKTVSGKDYLSLKNFFNISFFENNTIEVKGQVSFKGHIKGKVKIVKSVEDIKKVEKGDILVSPMTVPSFIPAMETAAAFVTDEGGILCHAAIVSREMHKPCVIGTKIATKIFKDGDLVEVDAEKGIVKKLK
jgi:phosphoenolpyruvate synthase/pyruvate phosphate dikinase